MQRHAMGQTDVFPGKTCQTREMRNTTHPILFGIQFKLNWIQFSKLKSTQMTSTQIRVQFKLKFKTNWNSIQIWL